jgi:hypothetical protein
LDPGPDKNSRMPAVGKQIFRIGLRQPVVCLFEKIDTFPPPEFGQACLKRPFLPKAAKNIFFFQFKQKITLQFFV